jgi:hypothetical protein
MFQIRLLDNTIENDVVQLQLILNNFLENEKNKISPVYDHSGLVNFVSWIKSSFLVEHINDFVIAARFYGTEIDQIYVAHKLQVGWPTKLVSDALPYWVLALMYFKETEWKSPSDQILDLEKLVITHFEKQHYTTGYIIIKAPRGLLSLTDNLTVNKYINNVLKKTLPASRYDFTVEYIFKNQHDLDNFKFSAFKCMFPKGILKPVAMLSIKLKYENRVNW